MLWFKIDEGIAPKYNDEGKMIGLIYVQVMGWASSWVHLMAWQNGPTKKKGEEKSSCGASPTISEDLLNKI